MQSYFKSLLYFLFVIVICSGKIANFKCDQLKLVLNCSNVTDLSFVGNLKQIEELVIDVSNLTYIDSEEFPNAKYLKNISIINSHLQRLKSNSFSSTIYLLNLNLSNNKIESLPQNFLKGSAKLRSLSLSHNKIQHLSSYQFSSLPQLFHLDISSNNISSIHREAFGRIGDNLRKLFLHNNNLKSLSATVLLPLAGLELITLNDNPWTCNCDLRKLRDLVVHQKLESEYEGYATCKLPANVSQKHWTEISSYQFACPPHVSMTRVQVDAILGHSLDLTCSVHGSPIPAVKWMINETLISDDNSEVANDISISQVATSSRDLISSLFSVNLTQSMSGVYSCVAINAGGVAMMTTQVTVRHMSLLYMITWELWFLILLSFILIFSIFVATICSVMFRKGKRDSNEDNTFEPKPEIEFQYAETFLREWNNCDQSDLSNHEKESNEENDKCQEYISHSNNYLNAPFAFNLNYNKKPSADVSLLSNITEEPPIDQMNSTDLVPWTGQGCHSQGVWHKKPAKVRKVPPPTLPKPKFHPSFLYQTQ